MSDTKIKVKLVGRNSRADVPSVYRAQLPGDAPELGRCTFTFDPFDSEYDWLVMVNDVPRVMEGWKEPLACPKEHTIFVTTEPSSITYYGKAFVSQFHYLLTNQNEKALPHSNAIRSQTGNEWFYGRSYDEIVSMEAPHKTQKLSTICSDKRQGHTLHRLRYDFTKLMQERIPELERFGRGFRWIDTKAEGLDAYQFHVAIENHYAPDVWTEKLADAFLGYCVPIYYGCPNVYDYFPKESLILIDINDFEGSIEKIRQIISTEGEYERRLEAVKEARRRVIEEYNLLAMINRIVSDTPEVTATYNTHKERIIYNRRHMRATHPRDLAGFLAWKGKGVLQNIVGRITE